MLEFILARYNYWIAIILMMTGLYIVFSRGNLVKKIIGLNFFQTSVFIYYISIGKVAGGTAPIFLGGHGAGHGDGHDGSEGDAHSDGHGAEIGADHAAPHGAADKAHGQSAQSLHNSSMPANDLNAATDAGQSPVENLHADLSGLSDKISNTLTAPLTTDPAMTISAVTKARDEAARMTETLSAEFVAANLASADEASHGAAVAVENVIYSNPLPHVLILTAIVVGVATTAVGLALAVRIREAYGTIEEDELEAADHVAEFGEAAPLPTADTSGAA